MARTEVKSQDLQNDLVANGQEKPVISNNQFYGKDTSGNMGFHTPGVTGANNGLDKDGANIVLGQDIGEAGDPAKLLSNREIPMDGKNLELEASNGDRTIFNGTDGNLDVGGNEVYLNRNGSDVQSIYRQKGQDTNGSVLHRENVEANSGVIGFDNIHSSDVYFFDSAGSFISLQSESRTRKRGNEYHQLLSGNDSGKYYLGIPSNFGEPGQTVSVNTLPQTSTDPDVETLGIKGSTGQIVRTIKNKQYGQDFSFTGTPFNLQTITPTGSFAGLDYREFPQTYTFIDPFLAPAGKVWLRKINFGGLFSVYDTTLKRSGQGSILRATGNGSQIWGAANQVQQPLNLEIGEQYRDRPDGSYTEMLGGTTLTVTSEYYCKTGNYVPNNVQIYQYINCRYILLDA